MLKKRLIRKCDHRDRNGSACVVIDNTVSALTTHIRKAYSVADNFRGIKQLTQNLNDVVYENVRQPACGQQVVRPCIQRTGRGSI